MFEVYVRPYSAFAHKQPCTEKDLCFTIMDGPEFNEVRQFIKQNYEDPVISLTTSTQIYNKVLGIPKEFSLPKSNLKNHFSVFIFMYKNTKYVLYVLKGDKNV